MGKCSVCGYSDIVQMRTKCLRCHVGLCAACASEKGIVESELGYRYLYCPKCAEEETQVRLSRLNASQARRSECPFCGSRQLDCWIKRSYDAVAQKTVWDSGERCTGCGRSIDSRSLGDLKKAEEAEKSGRFEESARLFDDLEMHERAGQVRDEGRRRTVKNHDLDADQLILLLQAGGFVIPYKCTHCGARNRFDKDRSAEGFFICERCGTTLEAADLRKVLRGLL
jgi:peptide subunit release factor 1 (eRF1)